MYLESIAEAKINMMNHKQIWELRGSHGSILIMDLPSMADVMSMTHKELLRLLKHSPTSLYFGCSRVKLNGKVLSLTKARQHALDMIKAYNMMSVEAIPEFPSS